MATLQDFKAELFRALGSPVRIRILEILRETESLTVGELQQRLGIESSNISQHLSVLRNRGLIQADRKGTSIWYSLAEPELGNLLDAARAIFEHQHLARSRLLGAP
ncbi:hypothetical protein AYO38_07360 [bacterium SCGC AG-212-C10]|nr:hypothetical protein AYO38_07360 [bacterium SCGC AG-212-C10]